MEELRLKDIIVIDDNEHDLNSIVKALRAEKQFVIPVHFTDENSSNMDILESYITSNKVIRCVISDINLIEVSTYQPSTAAKHLADNVLSRFLSNESRNYILFVWTSKDTEEDFELFKSTLYDTLEQNDIKKPLNIIKISKNECKTGTEYDSEKIIKVIKDAMFDEKNKALLQLIHWEKSCEIATADTVESLLKLKNTSFTLKKLLLELVGKKNIGLEPENIINVLLLLLKDNLNKISTDSNTREIWKNLFEKIDDNQDLELADKAKINTTLHLDLSTQQTAIICPGDFFEICDENVLKYCFLCDKKDELITYYVKNAFDLKKEKMTSQEKAKYNSNREVYDQNCREQIRKGLKLGLLEISAACDFTNNKKISNMFVLGVLAPKLQAYDFNKNVKQSIISPLLLELENNQYYFFIDSSYIFSLNSVFINTKGFDENIRFEKKFRLRDIYLQSLIQQIAHHNSRIGIISLK